MQNLEAQVEVLRLAIVNQLEAKINFKGQAATERIIMYILWSSGFISFVVGFIVQDLLWSIGIFGIGFLTCAVITLPAYKQYNSNPIEWLSPLSVAGEPLSSSEQVVDVESKKDL